MKGTGTAGSAPLVEWSVDGWQAKGVRAILQTWLCLEFRRMPTRRCARLFAAHTRVRNSSGQCCPGRGWARTGCGATSSFAVVIGERAQAAGLGGQLELRLGVFGSERWSELTRSRIEALLGLKAFDIYGLTELWGPGAGIECPEQDGIHVWTDHYLIEIVDPQTLRPVPPGTRGEIVVTTLRKQATPLLRYRTRDLSSLDLTPCRCGSPYPRIARLTGRSDDMVKARGVLFFPAQVEHVVTGVEGSTGEYRIDIDRGGAGAEQVRVQMEAPDATGLADRIASLLRTEIGLRAVVEIVEPGTLPRSERKTRRVFDHRQP
jgi:phenylacetate-CoA ligase